jgi:GH24 family phage-related lysozyme (muramidase)
MNLDLTKRWITRWEGRKNQVYNDSEGIATIGIGFNLEQPGAKEIIESLFLNYEDVLDGLVLTDDEIDTLFEHSLSVVVEDAQELFPSYPQYPEGVQVVIYDLLFNLGLPRFIKFANTIASIRAQDWTAAASNLKDSMWFKQVGAKPSQRGGADCLALSGAMTPEDILAKF